MAERLPVAFDNDNPEWTDADFARARPIAAFPELAAAFAKSKGGRPTGSNKEQVSLRLDKDVVAKLRSGGPGWQTRANDALRKALGV